MAAPVELIDALAAAGAARADAEMRELLLRTKSLPKYKCDKSDLKYPQYKQAHKEAGGKAQTARNAVGEPMMALVNYYRSNPSELDALFGIV
ncbi:MAG: hypothetical protein DIZ77_09155 [endosymbiont of Seepiophila jonesi]|uniref:Uncharacterized protein n=1 Tax=endosymbiont of Lamellibrachia luymesi TaxID=2200907 RepID=A0A370D766_9GAMM|nr:MAG: hypothetical protein DIZ79_18900 [endosymbiont of Lamellibrachia luymesi]RDH92164.1 MAG: hypothetical protein DIZ77_09155 [endosymbiont of Seepiophila jonesi]